MVGFFDVKMDVDVVGFEGVKCLGKFVDFGGDDFGVDDVGELFIEMVYVVFELVVVLMGDV